MDDEQKKWVDHVSDAVAAVGPKTPADAMKGAIVSAAVSDAMHLVAICEALGIDAEKVQCRAEELMVIAAPKLSDMYAVAVPAAEGLVPPTEPVLS